MRKINRMICFLVVCVLLFFTGCNPPSPSTEEPKTQSKTFYEYFDTECAVFSYLGDQKAFSENAEFVRLELEKYHRLFDIYFSYAGVTNLNTLNKTAKNAPVAVSDELFAFLVYAKEMYSLTNGKVNIAMGAVLSIWHDVREIIEEDPTLAVLPTKEQLEEANLHTNIEDLILDAENKTVYYADAKMKLDVGALAKGYACEKIAEKLMARGVTSYVLNFGGNMRAIGTKVYGNGWVTGIRNPFRNENPFVLRMILKDASLVTSGDYQRYFVYEGVKYHHIIDPETLYPTTYFTSVSILTEDSALADALSTAFFCMPRESSLLVIEALKKEGITVDVLWVGSSGEIFMTDGFSSTVVEE